MGRECLVLVLFAVFDQGTRISERISHDCADAAGKPNIKLRDFRTVHVQWLLREIGVGRGKLVHVKV
jgi:hypothetical protein